MRKLVFLTVVTLVMALAVPVGAKSISHESDNGYMLKEYVGDGATHAMWNDSGGWFDAHYGLDFDCPEFPGSDDVAWARVDGDGGLYSYWIDPLKGRDRYMSGAAAGVFEDGLLSYGFCDDSIDPVEVELAGIGYELSLDGTGSRLEKGSVTDSHHVPGVSSDRNTWKSTIRRAFGKVDLGVPGCAAPCTTWSDGEIGIWAYSNHSKSH